MEKNSSLSAVRSWPEWLPLNTRFCTFLGYASACYCLGEMDKMDKYLGVYGKASDRMDSTGGHGTGIGQA